MDPDLNAVDEARGCAVLLHPHPSFGGNRHHPFIDGLFRRLPPAGVSAVRFDFSTAEVAVARGEVLAALDVADSRWPGMPAVLAGYSFGAGVAAGVADERVAGWYLLAPPASMLEGAAAIGRDRRPKVLVAPEHDQYSTPEEVEQAVAGWEQVTVTVAPGIDHYLGGAVGRLVDDAVQWIAAAVGGSSPTKRPGRDRK